MAGHTLHRFFIWLLAAMLVVGALAPATALAQFIDDEWDEDPEIDPKRDTPPRAPIVPADGPAIIEGRADTPWMLRAERHEDGKWYLLMQAGFTLGDVCDRTGVFTRLKVTPQDRDPQTRAVMSLLLSELGGLFLESGGLKRGDVLQTLNGEHITSMPALREWMRKNPQPDHIELALVRDGKPLRVVVYLCWMPARDGRQYTVAEGDTLAGIADANYGNPRFYRLLVKANSLPADTATTFAPAVGTTLVLPGHPALQYPAVELAEGVYAIPPAEHTAAMDNDAVATLLQVLRPMPATITTGGAGGTTVTGLRLTGVSRQALPYRRGMQRGDIILSINGVKLEKGEDLRTFYNEHRQFRCFEVVVARKDSLLARRYWLLPPPSVPAAALLPPAISALPAEFGCARDTAADAALATELGCPAEVWNVTRAQTRFLSRAYREILHEIHLLPVLSSGGSSGNELGFAGLLVRYSEPDTLPFAFGLRSGDVLHAVRLDGGEWKPVNAAWQLVAMFPLGLELHSADFRVSHDGQLRVIRAVLVPTPDGIDEPPLFDAHGLPVPDPAAADGHDTPDDSHPDDGH
ncbi:MAG: hypothetical protein AB7K09_07040 [Planctomycetota bacterium]